MSILLLSLFLYFFGLLAKSRTKREIKNVVNKPPPKIRAPEISKDETGGLVWEVVYLSSETYKTILLNGKSDTEKNKGIRLQEINRVRGTKTNNALSNPEDSDI